MSAFAGIVTFDGTPVDQQTEDAVSRSITILRKGRTITRRLDSALFAQQASFAGGSGYGEPQPLTGGDGRTLFAALARLDNREELGVALGLTSPELVRMHDA